MTSPKPPAEHGDDVQDNIYDSFNAMRLKAIAFRSERDALQAKLDEANLLALSLQGQIVTMMAQPTEAWLIRYFVQSIDRHATVVERHNAIADYRQFDSAATVTELIPRVSPL